MNPSELVRGEGVNISLFIHICKGTLGDSGISCSGREGSEEEKLTIPTASNYFYTMHSTGHP